MTKVDCGDNSCRFAPYPRTGMRTNGGCSCLENLGFRRSAVDSLPLMVQEIIKLREELKRWNADWERNNANLP